MEKLSWPSAPRTIITGIAWSEDDLFKLWAGDKVENGASLVTIQHGGNYGVALWNFFEEHQIKISDKFLTWGWGDDINDKIIPAYMPIEMQEIILSNYKYIFVKL